MIFTPISALEIVLGAAVLTATVILALAVYLRNSNSWTSRFFILLSAVIGAYIILNPISLHPPIHSPDNQLFWIRIVMFTVSFMTPILFLLVHTFPHNNITLSKPKLIAILAIMFAAAAISLTPLVFQSISYPQGKPVPQPGAGMPFFILNFAGFIFLSFIVLWRKYKKAIGLEKIQTTYFLAGIVCAFTLMTISTVVLVVAAQTSVGVVWGPIYPVILMLFIAYAIVRHRFLDIQPIIARAISFVLVSIAVAFVYAFVVFFSASFIVKTPLPSKILLISTIIATALIVIFHPLQKKIKKLTDRFFFNGLYDPEALIFNLSHIMTETIDLDELTKKLLNILMQEMRITKAAFLIIDNHRIKEVRGIGYNEENLSGSELEAQIHRKIKSRTHTLIIQDIEDTKTQELFRKNEIEALIPIRARKQEIAILIMGSKMSDVMYSSQDLNLLNLFASGAGAAIQNARLYTDLKLALEAKSQFISIVSHQLRSSLTSIRWALEFLMKDSNIAGREKLLEISKTVNTIIETINDLLGAAQIEVGGLTIRKEKIVLEKIILDEIAMLKPAADAKGVEIVFAQEGKIESVMADKRLFGEALKNILDNAVTYAPGGSQIKVFFEGKDNEYIVSVHNEGKAIPKLEQEKIFTKFYRGEEAQLLKPNGSGLGLFIAKSAIEAIGGKIWFRSPTHENTGVIFYISIPRIENKKSK